MNLDELLQNVLAEKNSAFFYTPSVSNAGSGKGVRRKESKSIFFLTPAEIIEASSPCEIDEKLKKIDKLIKKGLTGYGYISYEAGYAFEERLEDFGKENSPLLKFCFFRNEDVQVFKSKNIQIDKWNENSFDVSSFDINTSKEKYQADINKIKNYISEGDTYQVNYTVKGSFDFYGSPVSLFKKLIFNQSAGYSAFINSGENLIISLSPELFFYIKGNKILVMPMKGTAKRGFNIHDDEDQLLSLVNSDKNKAENLMIVDLLRNDLGRISNYGSVKVRNMFAIEKYETLFQKITTVYASLVDDIKFSQIIRDIFPSGSITGAPKIRTMQIINELETERRGIYTGAIGIIKKDEKIFNVAIRTLSINKTSGKGEIGIGSGIVWDSIPEKEYEETLLKSEFLLKPDPYFELFETMLVENGEVFLLDEHLERLKSSADYFLFNYYDKKIHKAIAKKIKALPEYKRYRMKLILNKYGRVEFEIGEFFGNPEEIRVIVSEKRISAVSKFQYFKTTNRKIYDTEYAEYSKKGFFDVIFLNEKNEVCEGAITNIFIRKGSVWLTPPVSCGLLSGVFRNYWMQKHPGIEESILYYTDLKDADEIILTNSLRKAVKVDKMYCD